MFPLTVDGFAGRPADGEKPEVLQKDCPMRHHAFFFEPKGRAHALLVEVSARDMIRECWLIAITRFPSLRTLIVLHPPPLHTFTALHSSWTTSITTLQIGVLPREFSLRDAQHLSHSFPHVKTLQILAGEIVHLPLTRNREMSPPLFSDVTDLHVGVPWNYFPLPMSSSCRLFVLLSCLKPGSVFPKLRHLAVEKSVAMVSTFIERHARSLEDIACSSDNRDVFHPLTLAPVSNRLSTVILHVDRECRDLSTLPSLVSSVVVVLPFLPRWRVPRSIHDDLMACLQQIRQLAMKQPIRLSVEHRKVLDGPALARVRKEFREVSVDLRSLRFRTFSSSNAGAAINFALRQLMSTSHATFTPKAEVLAERRRADRVL